MKKKIAVLFPGIGYTCDRPLLYYAGKIATLKGYKLIKVEYSDFPSGIKGNEKKMEEAFQCGLKQAEKVSYFTERLIHGLIRKILWKVAKN